MEALQDLTEALDENAIHATLADLVSINSVNPQFPGGPGEAKIADYIAQFFQANNIPYERQAVYDDRVNIIAKLEGKPDGHTLLLEAHMDTATELGMCIPPFEPTRDGNRLYGRGSCDTKAGLAAMMHAMKALAFRTQHNPNTVIFLAAVDEEHSFQGINRFVGAGFRADGAIVAEPTTLQIVTASKGILRWRFSTKGKAAHSSKPNLGVNAISAMSRILVALDERSCFSDFACEHPLLGFPTMNVGIVRGGNQVNQVPDICVAEVDRRWVPMETRDQVIQEFQMLVEQLKEVHPEIEMEMEPPYLESHPLESASDSRIVSTVSRIVKEITNNASLAGVPYGSDAAALAKVRIPAVILGPGNIDQAHGPEEYVELDQVTAAARIYVRAAMEF